MQHSEETNFGAEMFGVGGNGAQGFPSPKMGRFYDPYAQEEES
jgi:hypothetical protein